MSTKLLKQAIMRKLVEDLVPEFTIEFRPDLGTIGKTKTKGTLGTMGGSVSKIRTSNRKVRSDKGRKRLR